MRQHDGPVAFRHARVSQIEIMLCGHYNRKYGAPGPVRNPPGTHLFQKRIIIYYYIRATSGITIGREHFFRESGRVSIDLWILTRAPDPSSARFSFIFSSSPLPFIHWSLADHKNFACWLIRSLRFLRNSSAGPRAEPGDAARFWWKRASSWRNCRTGAFDFADRILSLFFSFCNLCSSNFYHNAKKRTCLVYHRVRVLKRTRF